MNSFQIKVLAIVSMIIDHIGFIFFPHLTIMRIFGRLAFPLFSFLVSEGFTKTSNPKKYLWRLSTFAVISQIPYVLMIKAGGGEGIQLNIFFTLSAGLLGLILINKYKNITSQIFIILSLCIFSSVFHLEYGVYGILLILSSYLFLKSKLKGTFSIFSINILNGVSRFLSLGTYLQVFALASLPFMYLYNGKKGPDKYRQWFYYVYPVHMVMLVLLAYFIK